VQTIALGSRPVGDGCPAFIIAEMSANHDGRIEVARAIVEMAAKAGADCVKLQTYHAEEFMGDRTIMYKYRAGGREIEEPMYAMFKRLELDAAAHSEIFAYVRRHGLVPLSSAADPDAVDLLKKLDVPAIKLASEDVINHPLLAHAARTKLPLLLSTGMADEREITEALEVITANGSPPLILLHCISIYPTPDGEANLRRLVALRERFGTLVGFSDHTEGDTACLAAVSLGACVIEKHVTLDRQRVGPDHQFSSDPSEFKRLVTGIRRVETQLGKGSLDPSQGEAQSRKDFRRSVVASQDIPAGTVLTQEMLGLKKVGRGLHPRELPRLVGRRVRRVLHMNDPINQDVLE
jgi:N-acetylneuraminate synthase/N,N'-diacetyllegionaminate synthase